ncbi:LuxR C-terminal-related transcriptional regulator [Rhizobium sp. Root482]|uniref:LuxR C-terminal-related transcriptional regulator n=1 Tax=Rhizobium sp. Root482 TaxID=1736543 RepID=UPI0006F8B1DC|nr:response regulator transcription factor [Rhizobium sp. Root482]KQY26656.1 hypothetical protein ASD31_00110 [Rhizobium sp. Root482]
MTKIRIALLNSQPMLLDGMVGAFSSKDEYTVVARSEAPREAFEIANLHRPDVLVLDPSDPLCAPEVISGITRISGSPKIVVFTAVTSIEQAMSALEAGAGGYLTTKSTSCELREAVQTVHGGDTFISPSIATKLIVSLRTAALRKAAAQKMRLTVREEQIVGLLHKGKTNREIAEILVLSEKTVKHYMTVLMHKLAARSRLEVILALKEPNLAVTSSMLRTLN